MAEMQAIVSRASREGRPALISHVKSEFKKSALVSNTFFGIILLCLEKFIEKEFACPCKVNWNIVFAIAYLLVPAVAVFVLMMGINDFKRGMSQKETVKTVSSSIAPALIWIIIVFWDGHSIACMGTNWSGIYIEIDKAAPQKWCKPANLTSSQELDYKAMTQCWFFVSQCVGMGLIFTHALIFILHFKVNCCCQKKASEGKASGSQVNDNRDAASHIPLQRGHNFRIEGDVTLGND